VDVAIVVSGLSEQEGSVALIEAPVREPVRRV
jgi:hypothetical protein